MGLTRVALIRPVAITMMFLALAAMGIVAYTRLPVERFPPISFPSINIFVSYPGAAPEDVESLVTIPIENAVIGLNGIDTISSDSNEGSSRVGIRFVEGTDVNAASIDVERKVNQVRRRLPTDATDPSISKADVNAFPVMNIAVSSDKLRIQDLTQLVDDEIQPLVQSVPGVADATRLGGARRQIQIRVDVNKLRSYGISLTNVQNALANQNIGLPGGPVRSELQVFNTRTMALAQQPSDLATISINTPNGTGGGGTASTAAPTASANAVSLSGAANIVVGSTNNQVVYLKDVADVLDTTAFRTTYQRLNGNDAVGMSITAQSGVNGIKLSDDVRATL